MIKKVDLCYMRGKLGVEGEFGECIIICCWNFKDIHLLAKMEMVMHHCEGVKHARVQLAILS